MAQRKMGRIISLLSKAGKTLLIFGALIALTGFARPNATEEEQTKSDVSSQEAALEESEGPVVQMSGRLVQVSGGSWVLKSGGESKSRITCSLNLEKSSPEVREHLEENRDREVVLQAKKLSERSPWRIELAVLGIQAVEERVN